MNINDYVQLGGTVITVILFLQYLNKRDTQFNKILCKKDDDLLTLASNHISHSTEAMNKQTNAFEKLSICIDKLVASLDK